ncbi:hypothetical protein IQ252_09555 [Tychonema sp. LEGE 07203]|nr:hypothetical protein [Tychonema sp. LEGE 07203]
MLYHYQQGLKNRQDACSTIHKFSVVFDTKQALKNRQDACSTIYKFYFLWYGHLARTSKAIYMCWITY